MRNTIFGGALLLVAITVPGIGQEKKEEKKTVESGLPGRNKIQWHLRGLEEKFTLVKTAYNTEERVVIWLIETKGKGAVKPEDLGTGLFDEDRVRLSFVDLDIEGGIATFKNVAPGLGGLGGGGGSPIEKVQFEDGERLRVSLRLPDDEEWNRVRHVVVASKAVPPVEKK